jgi:hypothetical protein
MEQSGRSRLAGLLAELLVVFIGVLVALVADSWWQERGERARAVDYLSDIQAEMVVAGERLDSALAETQRFQRETMGFWSLLQSDQLIEDSVPLIVLQLYTSSVPLGTLDAVMQTADINLIEDDRVRSTLVEEHAELRTRVVAHDRLVTVYFNAMPPLMAEMESARVAAEQPPPFPNAEAIRGNAVLTGAYGAHVQVLRNSLTILGDMRASVDRVLSVLDGTLGYCAGAWGGCVLTRNCCCPRIRCGIVW